MNKDSKKVVKAGGFIAAGTLAVVAATLVVKAAKKNREVRAIKADPTRTATGGAVSEMQ